MASITNTASKEFSGNSMFYSSTSDSGLRHRCLGLRGKGGPDIAKPPGGNEGRQEINHFNVP